MCFQEGARKMKRLSICIDIDGTVTDAYYWLQRANEFFNLSIDPKEIRVYDIPTALNITADDYERFYDQHGIELYRQAEIRPGARQIIERLYQDHQVHFVSARFRELLDVTFEWFRKHQIGWIINEISQQSSLKRYQHPNLLLRDS